jgi:hypothetical protein
MKGLFLAILVILIIGFTIMGYVRARPHLWWIVWNAEVSYQGEPSPQSSIYRSEQNDLLLLLKAPGEQDSLYIIYHSGNVIGIPSGNQFIFLPFTAFSKDVPPPAVMSNNSIKIEIDMKVVVDEDSAEFTTLNGGRVLIRLP